MYVAVINNQFSCHTLGNLNMEKYRQFSRENQMQHYNTEQNMSVTPEETVLMQVVTSYFKFLFKTERIVARNFVLH